MFTHGSLFLFVQIVKVRVHVWKGFFVCVPYIWVILSNILKYKPHLVFKSSTFASANMVCNSPLSASSYNTNIVQILWNIDCLSVHIEILIIIQYTSGH